MKYVTVFLCVAVFFLGYGLRDMGGALPEPLVLIPASGFPSGIDASFAEREQASPMDRISEEQILVLPDRVTLNVQNAVWATFTDTNSMDPVIDAGSNAIQVVPLSPADISVGDIISYESSFADGIIIHRVVEVGSDDLGWYARAKGDNNNAVDPEKIRFESIKRVVVAIVY